MFSPLIEKVMRREDLTSDEAAAAMGEVMEGRAADAQIAALLIGLAMKGERPAEIVGLARSMRDHAVKISRQFEDVFDTCGTGGDRSGTFNISSAVAHGIMEAAGETGIPIAFGVLTTDTEGQAVERAGSGRENKGWEAAAAGVDKDKLLAVWRPHGKPWTFGVRNRHQAGAIGPHPVESARQWSGSRHTVGVSERDVFAIRRP